MRFPGGKGASINLAASLEEQILTCTDRGRLLDLLDTQALTAAPTEKLDAHLRTLIEHPVPYVTAMVFRVYRFTGCRDENMYRAAAAYLNLRAYNGRWYEETIAGIGWANEHLADDATTPLTTAYEALLNEARLAGDADLLEFCHGYRRD